MRSRLGWAGAVVVAVGCSGAPNDHPEAAASHAATARPSAPPSAAPGGGPVAGGLAAEVVGIDPVSRTVTLREAGPGGTATVPVEVSALGSLRDYKAGDRVVVSCRTTGSPGVLAGCGAVTSIRRAR